MKAKFLLIIAFLFLTNCKREQKISSPNWEVISSRLQYKDDDGKLDVKSGNFNYSFEKNKVPFNKIILLNASLMGFVSELEAENVVIGIASPEYIYSEKIHGLIKSGKIQNVGNEQKYDVEKIISMKPDAIFTNYIASFDNTYQLLKNNNIQVIFLDEYMEQSPMVKTSYIKLFGKLLGKEKEAEERFNQIQKNYNDLKKIALQSTSKPNILANEMYGDVWYMPGGKTFTANYIADANAHYILRDNTEEKAVTMSFEEVFAKSKNIQFWVNAGNHLSKKEMLNINPFYGKLDVFNKGKIYGVSGKEEQKANDFFESGVVRSDVVLKDYIKIFHPELLPGYQLTYMNEVR